MNLNCGEREKAAEMGHTPEPWYASNEDGNWRVMAADENGGYTLADMCCDDQEANARRIVACVNACEGYTTEELERISDSPEGLRAYSIEVVESLTSQRDELLAALVNARNCLESANEMRDGPITDTIWYGSAETLFDYMDSAIASVKGQP